ncbi:hypothetical protein [Sulfitobacter pacificus]|nr:hypothetical protein [Sulfitobacter pacificus]
MRMAGVGLFLALIPYALSANTDGEEDRIVIAPLGNTDFEVIQGTNFGAAEYWCGAATYVERRRGWPETTPIYVKKPEGPSATAPGRKSVIFTTAPTDVAQAPSGLTLSVRKAGAMRKSAVARRYCRDAFTRSTK